VFIDQAYMSTTGITIGHHLLEESDFDLYKGILFFLNEKMVKIHYISKEKKRKESKLLDLYTRFH
jgi:hypothetical protein